MSDFDSTVPLTSTMGGGDPDQGLYLVVAGGDDSGRLFEVESSAATIGRSAEADQTFNDPNMSGVHCRVRLVAGQLLVEDMGSTNGVVIDGARLEGAAIVGEGAVLRVGRTVLTAQRRLRDEVARNATLTAELEQAAAYVRALLPKPLDGPGIRSAWRFLPSVHLGGDAFGHHTLPDGRFVFYLLDVCGHGPGAALHSVSAMNVLRHGTARDTDFGSPAAVLARMNDDFQMDDHDGRFLTLWYGVYDPTTRELRYATAGHPPALLREPSGEVRDLPASGVAIGMMDGLDYDEERVTLEPGSGVYLYSDGVFEIFTAPGELWSRQEFMELVAEPVTGLADEADRLERGVRAVMMDDSFEDDFSLLVVAFD